MITKKCQIVLYFISWFLSCQSYDVNWDFIQSCFFCLTILTTIGQSALSELFRKLTQIIFPGYGNFAASTFGGRLFCLIFGMVGIPFMLSVLADVGGLMAEGIEYTWLSNRDRLRTLAEKLHIVKQRYLMAPL